MNKRWSGLVSSSVSAVLAVLLGVLLAGCGGGGGASGGNGVVAISATATSTAQILTVGITMTNFTPLAASGGTTPYAYSYTGITPSDKLPSGLKFNTSTGEVSGTPTVAYPKADLVFSVQR